MDFFANLDSSVFIVALAALFAAGSFVGFALFFMGQREKKERYKEVIEKKRRALFDQAREAASKPQLVQKEQLSAAKSVAFFFKVRQLAGETGKKARNLLLRAGIRDPRAPLIYLSVRIVLPIVFLGLALMLLSKAQGDMANTTRLMILGGAALAGFFLPYILIKNSADKRQQDISLSFPDSLDMMLICVQGGIGIEAAINRIADTVSEHSLSLAEELGILCAELGMLNDRRGAFQNFAARVGSGPARTFATAMLQAEQYGTSVSKALRVLAEETRAARMATAEQKAASLPPKLTVPMILFFLPCLFVVILGPAFLKGFSTGN
jgi:tight adherence protein C